jgi:hypothetical protein
MPPIRPQLLPRPYGWQVFQERQDPNNPYNLIDAARDVRAAPAPPREKGDASTGSAPSGAAPPRPQTAATAPPAVSAPPPPQPLALSDEERKDLALLVELTQQRAPATFHGGGEEGGELVVELAHSRAFEARVHRWQADRGEPADGRVVLFSAEATTPTSFHPNFTFAQGHLATHPDPEDPRQVGLIAGSLGPLSAGQKVLGYVVLPSGIDLAQPLDVYWNDRRVAATLAR